MDWADVIANNTWWNNSIEDCIIQTSIYTSLSQFGNTILKNVVINNLSEKAFFTDANAYDCTFTVDGSVLTPVINGNFFQSNITMDVGSEIQRSTVHKSTITMTGVSQLIECEVHTDSIIDMDASQLTNCYFGQCSLCNFISGDVYVGKQIIDRNSTFDVVENPDGGGVIDISIRDFVGIIRPNNNAAGTAINQIITANDRLDLQIVYNGANFTVKDGTDISHQGGDIDLDNANNKSLLVQLVKIQGFGSKLFIPYHCVQN